MRKGNPYLKAWANTNVFIGPVAGLRVPVPRGKATIKRNGARFEVQSRGQSWAIRHGADGQLLNAEGMLYLHRGLKPVNVYKGNNYVNFWQIALGYDYRSLRGRTLADSKDFSRQAAGWLQDPAGEFPLLAGLNAPTAGIFALRIGEETHYFGNRKLLFGNYLEGGFVAALDYRPALTRVELSLYEQSTSLPVYKWLYDQKTGKFYELLENHDQSYCLSLPPDYLLEFKRRIFIPASAMCSLGHLFAAQFHGATVRSVHSCGVKKWEKVEVTAGQPLKQAQPIPILVGSAGSKKHRARINGIFPAEARWSHKKAQPDLFFAGVTYNLYEEDNKKLKLAPGEKREIHIKVESGLVTEFIVDQGLPAEAIIFTGLRRDHSGELQAVFRRSLSIPETEQGEQIIEGIRTVIDGKRRWQVIINGRRLDLAGAPPDREPPAQVSLVLSGTRGIIYWRPAARFSGDMLRRTKERKAIFQKWAIFKETFKQRLARRDRFNRGFEDKLKKFHRQTHQLWAQDQSDKQLGEVCRGAQNMLLANRLQKGRRQPARTMAARPADAREPSLPHAVSVDELGDADFGVGELPSILRNS